MKIKEVGIVDINIPSPKPIEHPRRSSWAESTPRAVPMSKFPEFGTGLPASMPGMGDKSAWVRVTAEDGTWGLGRCGFSSYVKPLIDLHFAPLLEGRDLFATEHLNDLMWRSSKRFGSVGLSAVAQSGIDLALWDLKGKLMNQPVWRLLGGPAREKVKLYATSDDLDWTMELGFNAFKISNPAHYEMGIGGINLVEEKIHSAREQVGSNAELMFNPVMSYDVEFTLRLCERLKPYELKWLEEPLIPEDLEGHIELRRAMRWIPLATGEDHHTRIPFRQLVENRCVDVVQPDLLWCGGLTEAIKIYAISEAAGIKTVLHGGANTPFGQHFSYAMPEVPLAEFHLGTSPPGVPLDQVIEIPGMAAPTSGHLIPSDAPGFGLEIPEEWINSQ